MGNTKNSAVLKNEKKDRFFCFLNNFCIKQYFTLIFLSSIDSYIAYIPIFFLYPYITIHTRYRSCPVQYASCLTPLSPTSKCCEKCTATWNKWQDFRGGFNPETQKHINTNLLVSTDWLLRGR